MKRLGVINTAVLSLFLGASAFAYAPQEQQGEFGRCYLLLSTPSLP